VVVNAGASLPLRYQLVPLAVSVVVLGVPHGAVDHLAVPRSRGEAVTRRWLAAVGGLYLVAGGLYALVWFTAPVAAVVGFILLTWAHWGQGDLYPLVALTPDGYPGGRLHRLLTALTRGSLPMLVPLVAFPDQYELVVGTLVGLFDAGAAEALSAAFTAETRRLVGLALAALAGTTLAVGLASTDAGDRRGWLLDAGETLLLVAFFASVPPILAVGLYFCVWHSLRHVARLLAVDEDAGAALERRQYGRALWSFARDAAPLTAGALAFLGPLYLLVPGSVSAPLELLGTYLVLIAVLTLPHVVVVAWMDREQGIWTLSA
jgi:Brp/Blh family beta-carotene 15,15'-monooxygenase